MKIDYESEPATAVTCYHCHEHPPLHGSVFCHVCQPDRTGHPPRILAERFKPRGGLFTALRRGIVWLTLPWIRVYELEAQLQKITAESADFEQSNLAIRKKCADLRAQLTASTEVFDELHREHELIRSALRIATAERDEWRERAERVEFAVDDREALRLKIEALQSVIHHFHLHSAYKGGAPEKLSSKERALMDEAVAACRAREGISDE